MAHLLFVAGSSDLALQISKHFPKKNNICICRNPKKAYKGNYSQIIKLNLEKNLNFFSLKKIKSKISGIIFFNAYQKNKNIPFFKINNSELIKYFIINVISSIKIFYFLEKNKFLKKNCNIVFFSSRSGSISERGKLKHHKPGGDNLYRSSKAMLNCFVKNLAFEFKKKNYIFTSYHPGWVKTKMGGQNADMEIEDATLKFVNFFQNNKIKKNGKFLNYNLKEIGW